MTITDIAQSFSIGQFSQVLKHCQSIEHYFKRISYEYQIQAAHHVMIQGVTRFHGSKQTSPISACDVYNFDALNQLVQIQSYCISIQ